MTETINMEEIKSIMKALSINEKEAIEVYKYFHDIEDDVEYDSEKFEKHTKGKRKSIDKEEIKSLMKSLSLNETEAIDLYKYFNDIENEKVKKSGGDVRMTKKIDMEEIKNLMETLSISEQEAIELYKFDNDIEDDSEQAEKAIQEVEELTKKSNANKTNVRERSKVTNSNSKPKERKVDNEKKDLLSIIAEALKNHNIQIDNIKTETELSFGYNGNNYTLKLTKHRAKKS